MSIKKGRKDGIILGVKVNGTRERGLLRSVREAVVSGGKISLVTPNPEIILKAQKDKKLRSVINLANISIPDALGVVMADKFLHLPKSTSRLLAPFVYLFQGLTVGFSAFINRRWLFSDMKVIKGRELFEALIKMADENAWRVVLVGDRHNSAQKAVEVLAKKYQRVKIIALSGPNLTPEAKPQQNSDTKIQKDVVRNINKERPHLLFVGFGAPKQEKWMAKWLPKLAVNFVMVVGKTFEWVSGDSRVAPEWVTTIGLEWLWRLFTGSTTLSRILNAFPFFPLKVYQYKLQN